MEELRRGQVGVDPYYFKVDMPFYRRRIESFLPRRIVDVHAHATGAGEVRKGAPLPVFWAERICPKGMDLPSLMKSYVLMLPGKEVRPVVFPMPSKRLDPDRGNRYVAREAARFGLKALILTNPEWCKEELIDRVEQYGFVGLKPYPSTVHGMGPDDARIYDYLPKAHLRAADEEGWLVILHISRPGRLNDRLNLEQLMEIDSAYPGARIVVAHVGRAYCGSYGEAFEVLSQSKNLLFDISANSNPVVFENLIDSVGPERILFGSDMPIAAMHARRICEGNNYVNVTLGADWEDEHTRMGRPEDGITFFLYEEIAAFKQAAETRGLGGREIRDIFFRNAARILG